MNIQSILKRIRRAPIPTELSGDSRNRGGGEAMFSGGLMRFSKTLDRLRDLLRP
jgi:hypothetical protein